jgi:hypothetical protein
MDIELEGRPVGCFFVIINIMTLGLLSRLLQQNKTEPCST